jgi:RNA polymerase sigma-70 factor (ECF subfamily)
VSDQATAEDLTSDVFVRFLDSVHQGKAPQSTLRGWLYGTAAHVVADHYRRSARGGDVELERADETVQSDASEPELAAEETITWQRLSGALRHLTDDQRQVLAMRYALDLPIKEVAVQLGRSEGSVKQLQARAIATLTAILSAEAVVG